MLQKPFPWKCPNCRQKAVENGVVDYRDKIVHDGREYEIRIMALEVPQCKNCRELIPTDEVNKAIDNALRQEAKLLTPEQIRRNS